jgi:hypothetical protein
MATYKYCMVGTSVRRQHDEVRLNPLPSNGFHKYHKGKATTSLPHCTEVCQTLVWSFSKLGNWSIRSCFASALQSLSDILHLL